MFRIHQIILVTFICLAHICLAQRANYEDAAGHTIVVTPTTDKYGNIYSVAVSTISGKVKAGQASATVPPAPSMTSYRATYTVAQGSILDYSSYQSSVTGALNSVQAAAYKNYTATATDKSGLYTSFGISLKATKNVFIIIGFSVTMIATIVMG